MYIWKREYEFGRTKEEALARLDDLMIRKHPDVVFSTDMATVSEYGDENSDKRYIAEVKF